MSCDASVRRRLEGKYRTPTWMHDLLGPLAADVRLNEIALPGTHDSATACMTGACDYAKSHRHRVGRELVALWGKTQHRSVYEQLEDGIRYLDLRVERNSGGWWTFHGLVSDSLKAVLDDVAHFADRHRREIVVVDFQHLVDFDADERARLAEYMVMHPTLGRRLAGGSHFEPTTTVGSLWRADKNVIVLYDEGDACHFGHLFWRRHESISSPWPNRCQLDAVGRHLLAGVARRDAARFHVSQLVLTPDVRSIVSAVWSDVSCLYTMTIPSVSQLLEEDFVEQLCHVGRQHGRAVNIIIADFYEHTPLVEKCLDANVRYLLHGG